MSDYKAPIRDMRFVLNEVFNSQELFASMSATRDISSDLVDAILEGGAKITESLLAPINRSGDEEGCQFSNGSVTTPKGFKEAYKTFAEGGWLGLSGDTNYGGQGMPKMLSVFFDEMMFGANSSFALYPALTTGVAIALSRHASEEIKQTYLTKMYEGIWTGTMCLTEPHAGTDLGIINTKATPSEEGSYQVSGTKIFITGGEHDLSENIIHLVLAKLPDAPPGPAGISLFLVPKLLLDSNDKPSVPNSLSCGSIEHKMGIKGSATCVLNFDGATGFLVGEAHRGLTYMFTMMNYERLTIGLQGLALGQNSYQKAVAYARERVQGRAPTGAINKDAVADPIIVHPDIRRMLMTIKANTEAGRALGCYVGSKLDIANYHSDDLEKGKANKMVALLTPVAKTIFSDLGFESCVLAQQVLGGHGYIREWGLEQNVRDARISQIYEGANGIQALDLMGRKVVRDSEGMLQELLDEISGFCSENNSNSSLQEFTTPLQLALTQLAKTTEWVKSAAKNNFDEVGAASYPYLNFLSLVLYAYMWAKMAKAALAPAVDDDAEFYSAKLETARFYYARLFPRYKSIAEEIESGSESLMAMKDVQF